MEVTSNLTTKDKVTLIPNQTDKGRRIVITIKPIADPKVKGPTPIVVKIKDTETSSRIIIRTNRGATVLIKGVRTSFNLIISDRIKALPPPAGEAEPRQIELVTSARKEDIWPGSVTTILTIIKGKGTSQKKTRKLIIS